MNDRELVKEITRELAARADPKYREGAERYFKEGIVLHGVRGPEMHDIIRKYWAQVKGRPKEELLALCDMLVAAGKQEEMIIAFFWAYKARKILEPSDFRTLEGWLKRYVSNWAACDCLCARALGEFIFKYPEFIPNVRSWVKPKNRWVKRAAAVSVIISLRRGAHLEDALGIADAMLLDGDDMVQKGYGWMLKEGTKRFPDEIFEFVMERKDRMPRTALRYAIEKYPQEMRKKAMAK